MKSFVLARTIIVLVLVTVSNSAYSEYKAITQFRYCDLMGGCCGTKEDADYCDDYGKASTDTKMSSLSGNDGIDVEACEALAKNINLMEEANYDWDHGFAISANSFDLTLPSWSKASEKEVCDMYQKNDAKPLVGIADCKVATKYPIYYISYNLDNSPDEEKIYIRKHRSSTLPLDPYIIGFWSSRSDGSQFNNIRGQTRMGNDTYPVIFSSRLYFVQYGTSIIRDNNESIPFENTFVVHTFRFPGKESSTKEYDPVCDIQPISKQ